MRVGNRRTARVALAGSLLVAAGVAAAVTPACAGGPRWSGFYVGAHAAGAWSEADSSLSWGPGTYFDPSSSDAQQIVQTGRRSFDLDQYGGGVQAGVNQQAGSLVYGIEADATWLGGSGRGGVTETYGSSNGDFTIGYSAGIDWLATLRGRLGYAADGLLIYATAGLAIVDTRFDWSFSDDASGHQAFGAEKIRANGIFGGGIEYALSGALSAEAEYLYLPQDGMSVSGTVKDKTKPNVANEVTGRIDDLDTHLVRFGINYKLD
jgi:outer membrane immunogenic protein